ncbi:MAG: maleylpyruvate isomerase family mycothiol-dependent enzyme [Streptosporangiaceae bacterium]
MDGTRGRADYRRPVNPADLTLAARAAGGAADQLVTMLRAGPDPAAVAVGSWTVRDVAAHVAGGAELYDQLARGSPSPARSIETITALNDQILGTLAGQSVQVLADRIETAVAGLLTAADRHPSDPDVPWHAGLQIPLSTLLAVACGEYLVHGHDIARAAGLPWRVRGDWARTVFLGLLPIVPHYLLAERARGLRARYDIRMRGDHTARAVFTIDDGVLRIGRSSPGTRADCYLSADPWAFLLVLYSRTGPITPALAGRILTWGRRPWLALTLPSLFRKP